MLDKVRDLQQEIDHYIITSPEQLEQFRMRFISRKGLIPDLFEQLKLVPQANRRTVGQELNALKNAAQTRFDQSSQIIDEQQTSLGDGPPIDLTLPTLPNLTGTQHPLSVVRQRIIQIFERIGFNVADGPEIESDWYNFGALNFPENHPARDMQDTFFIEKTTDGGTDMLLRTHTSNVQIRLMEQQKPGTAFRPIRSIMPGAGLSE